MNEQDWQGADNFAQQIQSIAPVVEEPIFFQVKFMKTPNGYGFVGKGSIKITKTSLTLSGSSARVPFLRSATETDLSLECIRNVRANGKMVVCNYVEAGQPEKVICFNAESEDQAVAIMQSLPDLQTEKFATELKENSEFFQRLIEATPRVWVTYTIVALNLLVYLAMSVSGVNPLAPTGESVIPWGSNFGPLTISGEWWRLLSATFVHFGLMHLLLNMYAMFQTGLLVERLLGKVRFLLMYLFAGLSGSVASLVWNPVVNSAGASGAVFGVYGCLLAVVMRRRGEIPTSILTMHRNSTLIFIGYNLINGVAHAGIDNAAHIGGLLGGALAGFALTKSLDAKERSLDAGKVLLSVVFGAILLEPISNSFE